MKTPYTRMERSLQYLHGLSEGGLKKFIALANIKPGMRVLDAMCGKSEIGKLLSREDIELYLLDNSEFQIKRAEKSVRYANFFKGSILKTRFNDNFFDRVFIKNGAYEIPRDRQQNMYREVLRILKKGGLFVNWTFKINKGNQEFFQSAVRGKDRLAGYDDLVRDRYFMARAELENDLKAVGFRSVKFHDLGICIRLSTIRWCEVDFKGDTEKLNELNRFIKELYAKLHSDGIDMAFGRSDIRMRLPALISVAVK